MGGSARGEARPAAYGTWRGMRAVPPLPEVPKAEGMPSLQPAAAEERKMTWQRAVRRYVQAEQQFGQRVARVQKDRHERRGRRERGYLRSGGKRHTNLRCQLPVGTIIGKEALRQ